MAAGRREPILVGPFDGGGIVERGRHNELRARDGLYRHLWDAQCAVRFHAALEWLIARGRAFVVVIEGAGDEDKESQEDRTKRALWFKANMKRFSATCRGMIYVEPDNAKRTEWQRRAAAMANAFPVPMIIVESRENAFSEAGKLTHAL